MAVVLTKCNLIVYHHIWRYYSNRHSWEVIMYRLIMAVVAAVVLFSSASQAEQAQCPAFVQSSTIAQESHVQTKLDADVFVKHYSSCTAIFPMHSSSVQVAASCVCSEQEKKNCLLIGERCRAKIVDGVCNKLCD